MLSCFQLALLALSHRRTLRQFPLATAILVQLQHTGQIRLGEPLQLLRQTPGRLLQGGLPGRQFLRQPGAASSPPQCRFTLGGMAQERADLLPDHLVELRCWNAAGRAALSSARLGREPLATTDGVAVGSLRTAATGESAQASRHTPQLTKVRNKYGWVVVWRLAKRWWWASLAWTASTWS